MCVVELREEANDRMDTEAEGVRSVWVRIVSRRFARS